MSLATGSNIIHYTSSIIHLLLHQTSYLCHQTSFSNLGRVFYSLDEGGYDSQKLSSNSIATLNLET